MFKINNFNVSCLIVAIFCLVISSCNGKLDDAFKMDDVSFWGTDSSESIFNSKTTENNNDDFSLFDSQNELKMEVENGVRYVWIKINGLNLRFIFDTGASSICISPAEVAVLYRQGTLKKEDILDVQYFQDATGRISAGTKINLRPECTLTNGTINSRAFW